MPSDQSTWLIAVPQDGDSEGLLPEITNKLPQSTGVAELGIPSFKTGTLDSLIALSEELPKQDAFFTATVAKIVDTLRNLLNNDPAKLAQHVLVNERTVDYYLLGGWKWNESRYGVQRSLREMVDILNKEMASIDNVMKAKLNNYNLVKGSLVQMQRKKTGNLSIRSLVGLVSKEDIIQDSEYLETCLVAVPKILVKEWNLKYERLTNMIVPRSSSLIASDSEYTLFGVVVFKRVHDQFVQKCRENKFIVREFVYSEEQIAKEGEDLEVADATEKELWTELLRLSRTYFSESFQIFLHLKILRLFVESVLRYGLPANYVGFAIRPEPKYTKKTLSVLTNHLSYLSPRSSGRAQKHGTADEFAGEYQSLMEQEFFDFVLYEVPWIVL
ncbi:ATPase V1 complex subunit C [Suillus fuscotomentosus]|uniref:V-type proton ATPase subunit C n=1 Tax=Suillus fuscotomentosus TaxID=1912939 RepID=A0AAD4HU82_9AGAM|nr:ATPase V1 complex subunit C [Suillus fuscotomentosus]KAG1908441.1 ATPase V1 complex subunit C [Suillus fuscotomentosus]